MNRISHEPKQTRRRRRPRLRRRWGVEQLEARTLLVASLVADLGTARPLATPSDVTSAPIAPGVPVLFRISPAADALLVARNHAVGTLTRLSLLDGQGNVLVQSDGQSAANPDDLIVQHVIAGTDYLEVESLGGAGRFTLSVDLTASSQPTETPLSETTRSLAGPLLVFGDFNSDGRLDLATPDGVEQGAGDGTFRSPPVPLPIASLITRTVAMIGGDFNGDGHEDLVVAGYASAHGSSQGVVEVLLGNGDGTFRALEPLTLRSFSPTALVTGDFNRDNRPDLAIAGLGANGAGEVEVLTGNGDGTFGAPTTIPLGNLTPSALLEGDFNGDGKPDLALVGEVPSQPDTVELLLGQGDGTFNPQAPINADPFGSNTFHPSAEVAADFIGNGITDLAIAGSDSMTGLNLVQVLLGSADGTLNAAAPTDLRSVPPRALVAGDFIGNGVTDLAAAGVDPTGLTQVEVLTGNRDGSFNLGVPISLGAVTQGALIPTALFSGDYNGDGTTDLALAGTSSRHNGVTVLLGQAQAPGTFSPAAPTVLGALEPSRLVTGDFTGDGRVDVVLAAVDPATGHQRVELLPGNGDGTFADALPIDLGGLIPTALAAGDFNGDGRTDLAVAGTDPAGSTSVAVLAADSGGKFSVASTFLVGLPPSALPTTLVAGDFNGDHRADLALVSVDHPSGSTFVTVLLGNSDGTIRPTTPINLGALSPVDVVVADFRGEGRTDLAVAATGGDGKGVVDVLLSDVDGTLHAAAPIALGDLKPSALAAGDFHADLHADLAVAGVGPNQQGQVELLRGDGTGTFVADSSINLGTLFVPAVLVATDVNGDHRTDLVVAGVSPTVQGQVDVLEGNGNGTFHAAAPIALGAIAPSPLAAADLNGDGRIDLLVAGGQGPSPVSVLLGHGDGTFGPAAGITLGAGTPTFAAAGDFNNDNRTDLAVATLDPDGQSHVAILLSEGDGTFQDGATIDLGTFSPMALVGADFNGDGRADLAVAGLDPATGNILIRVFLGKGDGTFATGSSINVGSIPVSTGNIGFFVELSALLLVAGDFNGDGRTDLAVAENISGALGQGLVEVLMNDGTGDFGTPTPINLGFLSLPTALVAADFNGDGRADLAVAGSDLFGQPSVEVLPSNADGTFAAPTPILPGSFSFPPALAAGDFNGDGRDDLALAGTNASTGQNQVTVLLGNSDGTFTAAGAPIDLGLFSPTTLVAGDFNGDHHLDLAAGAGGGQLATPGSGGVAVLIGNGDGTFGSPVDSPLPASNNPLVAADLTGDGRFDLVIAGTSGLSVELTRGDGTFADPSTFPDATGGSPLVVDPGDGSRDVFVIDHAGAILWRKGEPHSVSSFGPPVVINPGSPSRDITFVPTRQGGLLASVDRNDDAVSFYGFRNGKIILVGSLTTEAFPAEVVAGDVNGDGNTDLVVRNAGTGTATVYLGDDDGDFVSDGDGDGDFVSKSDVPIGAGASEIALVPLDGTNRLDLVVTDQVTGTVSIFPGKGDGTFGAPLRYAAGSGPYSQGLTPDGALELATLEATAGFSAGTFSAGGTVGLATIDPGSNTLNILDGLGGDAFANPRPFATTAPAAIVRAGDFNGDGSTDLAVLGSDGVSVYLSNGRGGFAPPTTTDVGPEPTGLSVADVNGDGIPDLVVSNRFGDVLVLLGDGQGHFAPPHNLDRQIALAVADSGPSGQPTFALTDKGQSRITTQSGPVAATQTVGTAALGVMTPGGATLADLNGDGIPDLIVANSGANDILVYLGVGGGNYLPAQTFAVGTDPVSVTVAHLNGDSNTPPDLVVANKGSNDLSVLLGGFDLRLMSWGDGADVPTSGNNLVIIGADNNGLLHIRIFDRSGNRVTDTDETELPTTQAGAILTLKQQLPGLLPPHVLTSAEKSLVISEATSIVGLTPLGQGTGSSWTLRPGPRLKTGSGPVSTVVSDVNGDNVPDILVTDSQSNDVRYLQGLGGGFFNDVNPPIFQTGSDPGPLLVGNFASATGQPSLVTVNAGSNDLSFFPDITSDVLPQEGGSVAHGGVFVGQSLASGGAFPIAAVAGNFSGPGETDLLVANNATGNLALFLGGANGPVLSETFTESNLPSPTALTIDMAGNVFAATEGVDTAVAVILGLGGGGGGGGGGSGGGGGGLVGGGEGGRAGVAGGIGAGGFGATLPGPSEQQLSPLLPLSPTTLGLVATLLSVSVEMTFTSLPLAPAGSTAESVPAELGFTTATEVEGAGTAATTTTSGGLPNQPQPQGTVLHNEGGGGEAQAEVEDEENEAAAPAPARGQTQAAATPLARFVTGLDEAFARTRLKTYFRALFARASDSRTTGLVAVPALGLLDSLLERWTPVIAAVAGPLPRVTVELVQAAMTLAHRVAAAPQALEAEAVPPGAGAGAGTPNSAGPQPLSGTAPARPAAAALGAASFGLAALAHIHVDPVRPHDSPNRRRTHSDTLKGPYFIPN
jgi:hypothetical protein